MNPPEEPVEASAGTVLARGLRLRCPRCGVGRLFVGWFRMHSHCEGCGTKYERAPGYFLGSAYINYAATALLVTIGYVVSRYAFNLPNSRVLPWLLTFCVAFPLVFFRFARGLWLAMDTVFDPQGSGESDG